MNGINPDPNPVLSVGKISFSQQVTGVVLSPMCFLWFDWD